MLEFFSQYGSFLSLGALLLSDVIIFIRGLKNKSDRKKTEELVENIKQLISIIRGDGKE